MILGSDSAIEKGVGGAETQERTFLQEEAEPHSIATSSTSENRTRSFEVASGDSGPRLPLQQIWPRLVGWHEMGAMQSPTSISLPI